MANAAWQAMARECFIYLRLRYTAEFRRVSDIHAPHSLPGLFRQHRIVGPDAARGPAAWRPDNVGPGRIGLYTRGPHNVRRLASRIGKTGDKTKDRPPARERRVKQVRSILLPPTRPIAVAVGDGDRASTFNICRPRDRDRRTCFNICRRSRRHRPTRLLTHKMSTQPSLKNLLLIFAACLVASCSSGYPSGPLVFVTNERDGTVTVIDAKTDKFVDAIHTGSRPRGIRVSADGKHAYVAAQHAAEHAAKAG